jgi:hypothetical protein
MDRRQVRACGGDDGRGTDLCPATRLSTNDQITINGQQLQQQQQQMLLGQQLQQQPQQQNELPVQRQQNQAVAAEPIGATAAK